MGIHEWLLKKGYNYEVTSELHEYLKVYKDHTDLASSVLGVCMFDKIPRRTRAIAPTGTIAIIAETTSGIEPIPCVAYRRRYANQDRWEYQYIIDPTAKRLIDQGVKPENIEDAYALAEQVERRIKFQADIQQYVDHAISSTINLPSWGSPANNENTVRQFGETLMKYLENLKGITVYPNGSREGQPIMPVKYETAIAKEGQVFVEGLDMCDLTKAGTCG